MTLSIFSKSTIWSRTKQQIGKIGEIECLDAMNETAFLQNPMNKRSNDIFIGTVDGSVHKFRLREKNKDDSQTTNEKKSFECLCIASQNLGTRKAIVKLKAISAGMRRVIALTDNLIFVLDSDHLQVIPNFKLKNIVTFAVSSAHETQSAGSIDFCVSTKRNKLQIYRLDKTNINLLVELSTPEILVSMAMDEKGIIACSEAEYYVHNFSSSQDRKSTPALQSIFRQNDPNIVTCLTTIVPGEYLINGPNVGVTTSLDGISQRAPLLFEHSPIDFIYSHPYIIVLVRDAIEIYSHLDSQMKQEIGLKNCRTLNYLQQETVKTIIISTRDEIFFVEPLSLEEQINQLLQAFRLQEALTLAESSCPSVKQRQTNPLVLSTKKRIALIEFAAMNVERALILFEQIKIDFHEIANQIPMLLPIDSPWAPIDDNLKSQYIQWLNTFSTYLNRNMSLFSNDEDFHPALLKAYVLIETSEIIVEFIQNGSFKIPLKCVDVLLQGKFYHAAALLYSLYGKHFETIDIWKKLVTNDYETDETFPGAWFIAKYVLERDMDRSLEFSTAEWLLEHDHEELALKIFTDKHRKESNNDPFSNNRVIQRLKTHSSALILYLEHFVFKMKIDTDEIHTRLINIYLDDILSKSDEENHEIRTKLQTFIINSNSFRIQSVLQRINQTNRLRREVALLHGKMNQFEQAFRILIDELKDFDYAENYCVQLSQGKSFGDRRIIAHVLFKVLLSSLDKNTEPMTNALLRLLCNNEIDFDFIEVLQRLPADWSLTSLSQILIRALRTYSYTQRAKKIERALSCVQNENLKVKLTRLKTGQTIVNEYRRCKHCLQQFYESSCVVYQDGSQVHIHCAKLYNPSHQSS